VSRAAGGRQDCHCALILPSLYVLPRFVGEDVPKRALSPGSAGNVRHARDPHAVLELAGTANALVPLVPPQHLLSKSGREALLKRLIGRGWPKLEVSLEQPEA
jgi:hypothetical protein